MSSGGKGGSQVIGYRYFIGMQHVLCYGPIDSLMEIRVGDRTAWTGNLTSSQNFTISAPDLFGGDDREGGFGAIYNASGTGILGQLVYEIKLAQRDTGGEVDLMMGESTQTPNTYLDNIISALLPAYRGVVSLVYNSFYIGNNPYLKDIEYKVKNLPTSLSGTNSDISGDANPAHIIFEVLTNKDWGMGYTVNDVDSAGFNSIAAVLAGESFGLSFIWTQSNSIEEFINEVLRHINASLYLDRVTGKFVMKLVRDDYTLSSEPVFDESNIVELMSFARRTWGETINEVRVVYRDVETNDDKVIIAHDLANIQVQGTTVSTKIQYPGVTNGDLAAKLALRDLGTLSAPLAKLTIKVNREAWDLPPGAVFAFEWAKLGITQMAMRIGAIDYGTINDAFITIHAIEDIFGLPDTGYTAPQSSEWIDPSIPPANATNQVSREFTYWESVQAEGDSAVEALNVGAGFLVVMAASPSIGHFNYGLWTSQGSAVAIKRDKASFAPSGTMIIAMIPALTTVFTYENDLGMVTAQIGDLMQIETEICRVTAHNASLKSITISRGLIDTIPLDHSINTRFYVFGANSIANDPIEYVDTEVVNYIIITHTDQGALPFASSTARTYTMIGRIDKPYAPGNLRIEGNSAYVLFGMTSEPDLVIQWAHRDRTQQTQPTLILQNNANIGPEAGATYNLTLYGENGTTIRKSLTGLTGDTYTWTTEVADSGFGRLNNNLRIRLESVVSGELSFSEHDYNFERADYGYSYGKYYGGA